MIFTQEPYFLNSLDNIKLKSGIFMWYVKTNPYIKSITGTNITVRFACNNKIVTHEYPNLNNSAIALTSTPNTKVYVDGNIEEISVSSSVKKMVCNIHSLTKLLFETCYDLTSLDFSEATSLTTILFTNCTGLTSLDFSTNIVLKSLHLNNCQKLKSLDLKNNTALLYSYMENCNYIDSIKYYANDINVSKNIAKLITSAFATDGNVYCDGNYSSIVQEAAISKGWTYHTLE